VTIHEPDRLRTDDADRTSPQALVDRLNAGEPYAVAFGGQGSSSWLANLEELVTTA
jgi:fatty acid synthase